MQALHSSHPTLLPDHELRVKVKKENVERAFRSLKGSSTEFINLDSPSPQKSTATSSIVSLPPPKHMRNAIVSEPLMQQLCSQEQGPREAAMVVYALVRPAFMRLMKHDPLTLLDESILPPPPLPIPSAPVPQPCLGKLRDGSCLQILCIMSDSITL